MTEKKLISVVGATGSQGGGLVKAILDNPDGQFSVRALTRNAQSATARKLAAAGAEVVEADLDDGPSVRRAFEGAHGAFVVTNYWAELSSQAEGVRTRAERELAQADSAARAAKEAGVEHVVWSTLEDTRDFFGDDDRVPTVEERFKVPHFDAKAEADALFRQYGVPTTFLRTALFFEGFINSFPPRRGADGAVSLTLPIADQPMPGIAVGDIGKTALELFARGEAYIGKTVSIAGDHLTGEQYAAALSDALKEQVTYRPMTWDAFRKQGFPSAVEMGNMFQYYAENSAAFVGARDLAKVRELNPQLQSFPDWLSLHSGEIAVAD
ncbi:NmrA/HSCARG family protein [Mycobacterium kubicae]|nr:NmrA/HSCARG family protein [Mycobacterium kubicae]MCV7094239.1 NmrA/HSCARG family protein [Mycobacterium kubicae]OBF23272.1 nucleoside-diphosphate sugar epimerase [Mycobacterium kubicae]ORV98998.1 nucleoside-diphosphate sugar epimerase [Mycobacterium kubicae]QNI09950.1 NmrA/HSCARG family protein [Mycobacterium kubicae]QPI38149.1 NmrA/HSCARG family protein [Mycobacterium kubicae]